MKKAVIIVLLVVYGSTTIGATVHLHYCMEKFVGWSLWYNKDNKCGKCGMKEKKNGCCKDEHKQFKLKTEHPKNAAVLFSKVITGPAFVTAFITYSYSPPVTPVLILPANHAPPGIKNKRLHLLNCVFRI